MQEFQVVTRCPPMVPWQTALHYYRKFIKAIRDTLPREDQSKRSPSRSLRRNSNWQSDLESDRLLLMFSSLIDIELSF